MGGGCGGARGAGAAGGAGAGAGDGIQALARLLRARLIKQGAMRAAETSCGSRRQGPLTAPDCASTHPLAPPPLALSPPRPAEIIRWPQFEAAYGAEMAAQAAIFGSASEGGAKRRADLQLRIVEHNVLTVRAPCHGLRPVALPRAAWCGRRAGGAFVVAGSPRSGDRLGQPPSPRQAVEPLVPLPSPGQIAKYYTRITMARLAELLDLPADQVRCLAASGGSWALWSAWASRGPAHRGDGRGALASTTPPPHAHVPASLRPSLPSPCPLCPPLSPAAPPPPADPFRPPPPNTCPDPARRRTRCPSW